MNIRKAGYILGHRHGGASHAPRAARPPIVFLCTIMVGLVLYGCIKEEPEPPVPAQNTLGTSIGSQQRSPRSPEDEARLAEAVVAIQSGSISMAQIQNLSEALRGDLLSIFAARNEYDAVHRLIDLGIAPDTRDSAGGTALASAVLSDSLAAAQTLIQAGARPQAETDGVAVIDLARLSGSAEIAALVAGGKALDAGAYLRRAARKNDTTEVRHLLAQGANPNAADTGGFTPLIEATVSGATKTMVLLIEAGAKLDAATADGLTPAVAAVMAGNIDALDLLLGAGLNPKTKSRGVPLLTMAIMSGQTGLVDLLLKKGADPEQKSDDGARPAAIAKALGHDEMSKRLGGTPELTAKPDLLAAIRRGNAAAVQKALEDGADPNQTAPDGSPALIVAAATANAMVVDYLLARGADPFVQGPNQSSSIHAAFLNSDRREAVAITTKLIAMARQREQNPRVNFPMIENLGCYSGLTIATAVLGCQNDDIYNRPLSQGTVQKGRNNSYTLLTARDGSGRSGLTRLVTATAGFDHLDALIAELEHADLQKAASEVDRDGVSPYTAAVLTNNETFIKFFARIGATPTTGRAGETLQDLARGRKAWKVLAALPDDRRIPRGLKKGASSEVKKEMQRLLKEWGYYHGAIDGIFGAGPSAAMKRFLIDRREELLEMAEHNSSIKIQKSSSINNSETILSVFGYKPDWCMWKINDWYVKPGANESDQFVGCITGGKNWNANGVAYVHYGNGDEGVYLFGEKGWKDEVPLK